MKLYMTEQEALDTCKWYISVAWDAIKQIYHVKKPKPTVSFKRMGFKTIGRAYLRDHRIEMNTNFLYSKDIRENLLNTLKHEVCHLVNYNVFNSGAHDRTFRLLCTAFGIEGRAKTTAYARPDNWKGYIIKCPCCKSIVQETASRRAVTNATSGRYQCSKCKTNLKDAIVLKNA